jgi:hypothetical protein
LSRNTAGVIEGLPELGLTPHVRVERLLAAPYELRSDDPLTVKLLEWCSPITFEHLVVQLLQLEAEPGVTWHHIGGTGDGGVDGMALSEDGKSILGVLQCKWTYDGDVQQLASELADRIRKDWPKSRVVIAVLLLRAAVPTLPVDCQLLSIDDVSLLIEKHASQLPLARSLGMTS